MIGNTASRKRVDPTPRIPRPHGTLLLLTAVVAAIVGPGVRGDGPADTAPEVGKLELSPIVRKILDDESLNEAERRRWAIFHGQWDRVAAPDPREQAVIALARFDLDHESLSNEAASPLVRARAALERGDAGLAIDLLEGVASPGAAVVAAHAQWQQGRRDLAVQILQPWRETLAREQVEDAERLVDMTRAMVMLARFEGRPSRDYRAAMRLLAKAHQRIDRHYWPARLAEAELLFEKHNRRQALEALKETIALNPRSGRAWLLLGRLALRGFSFDKARHCIGQLRAINPNHLCADLLEIRMNLQQRDVEGAEEILEAALDRYPEQRELLALAAAARALAFDEQGMAKALEICERHTPGGAAAHYIVGRYQSYARQYEAGERSLRTAIQRFGEWPEPHVELGLLLMQAGKEPEAQGILEIATRMDRFHMRAHNQLKMVRELLAYKRIETPHFVIKYRDDVDAVMARDMPEVLERIYDEITTIFEHRPRRKTLIEIMPDDRWLGVRITGMPEIWTIAACTGDVIALVAPREGAHQRGTFDWENVVRHEFVHTVTLDKTGNRCPHWFTEACAVAQETYGRPYDTHVLLAKSLAEDDLFDLEEINWGFVRPKKPTDRLLAYAQSHWMYQYLVEKWGLRVIVRLLELYEDGTPDIEALELATGLSADVFYSGFISWAGAQVRAWGLGPTPDDEQLADLKKATGAERVALLRELIDKYPDHPPLRRLDAARRIESGDYDTARAAILRYAEVRPIDPWANRALLKLARTHQRVEDMVGPLEELDRAMQKHGRLAAELAEIYRGLDRPDQAAEAYRRALHREPFAAAWREKAAAVELERGERAAALRHVQAMTLIEPERVIQWIRLAAMHQKLGQPEKAAEAARQALRLDPLAPVEQYLQ